MTEYAVLQRGSRIVLPAVEELEDVSVWDDSEANMRRFAASVGVVHDRAKPLLTTAVLVRHEHNKYNSHAVSVSVPADTGETLRKRHLGYLRERLLNSAGQDTLPGLIDFAGGEVEVTIAVWSPSDLAIAIPPGYKLGPAVRAFLAPRGIDVSGQSSWSVPVVPTIRKHSGKSADTRRTLTLLAATPEQHPSVAALKIATVLSVQATAGRKLSLVDAESGRYLGEILDQVLNLKDESDRDQVLALLAAEQIAVLPPVAAPAVPESDIWPQWPNDLAPNTWARTRYGAYDLHARGPQDGDRELAFAVYTMKSDVLWVEDFHLIAPALRYFHRLGLNPARLGLPRKSWGLDDEVDYPSMYPDRHMTNESLAYPALFSELAPLLPAGCLVDEVTWVETQPELAAPDEAFHTYERYVRARSRLFPQHHLTGRAAPCRTCGRLAAAFSTPIATEELAYCQGCLRAARIGLVEDRPRAAAALQQISELEFDSQPMLAEQLNTLHINPAVPVSPALIDQLLALRFAVGRKRVAWTLLLEAAGFAEFGLRTGRGTLIRSRDGHLCLSMREKAVCDFLHQHDIAHDREPLYPPDPDYNASGLRRADWVLTDGTLVELWGLPKDPAYAAKMEAKRSLAARHGIRLLELFDADLPNLPAIFAPWIAEGTRSGWTWSPLLIATAEATEREVAKEAKASTGDNRGRNDYNTEIRRERLDRCVEAVRLQGEGVSRKDIGALLAVAPENVKIMLRDGKFYADPDSDPSRLRIAQVAAAARDDSQTRAQFQAAAGLTSPKAAEAWRDAGVLFDT